MLKNKKGITLVALVVTIVVLLILAGVSINMVLGENGIVTKAKEARDQTKQAQANESQDLDSMASAIDEILSDNGSGSGTGSGSGSGTGTGSGSETKVPEAATTETAPYFPDSTFTKKEGTIDTGLVIQDSAENEYIWVVVPRTTEVYATTGLGKTTFTEADYASIETDLRNYTSTYRGSTGFSDTWDADTNNEGWLTNDEYTELKNNMLKSVYLNGGFYVGRYEAGIETNRTSSSSTNSDGKYDITGLPTPLSQADAYPYTYVTRTQAQNLAKSLSNGKSYTSSLMFGVQWDLVLAFMSKDRSKISSDLTELKSNSTSIGNYYNSVFDITRGKYAQYGQLRNEWKKFNEELSPIVVSNTETGKMKKTKQGSYENSILITTGATEQSKVMNIYDIAGNIREWTLEKTSNTSLPCVYRGGCYNNTGSNYPASNRINRGTTYSCDYIGFRVSLF